MEARSGSESSILKLAAERLRESRKAPSSKYDYIKIKVWLGEGLDHYFILSRFLIARMLTVTKVSQDKAVKIALEVKKWLVDNNKLDLTQDELETVLFNSMRVRGYGDDYIQRYRMMNTFQQQKRPLIILICGSACTGKSTLAQQLASLLNLPNVLQIDAFRDLLSGGDDAPLPETPLYMRHGLDSEALVGAYKEECKVLRQALDGDLVKCICDGKSIIIEGLHLDPGLYIREFGKGGVLERRASEQQAEAAAAAAAVIKTIQYQREIATDGDGDEKNKDSLLKITEDRSDSNESEKEQQEENVLCKDLNGATTPATTAAAASLPPVPCRSKSIDEGLRTYGGPVFVPIVLRVDPEEYPIMAEEWLRRQLPTHTGAAEQERMLEQLIALQEYLSSYKDTGVPVMSIGVLKFQDTLDSLHDYVLECIQQSFSAVGGED
ncbi:hypothetical protein Ndes2526B_g03240 [Nannochloris sp. 'desiccata']